jgi:hypothetical protein
MNVDEFIKEIKRLRLDNKNKWYWFHGLVNGIDIKLKAYDTYLQIFSANAVNYGGIGDISVKDFIIELRKPFLENGDIA